MNFGKGILLAFIAFGIFMAVMMYIMIKTPVGLISENYYKEGIQYNQKASQMERARQLSVKPYAAFISDKLRISYKDWAKVQSGKLTIMCPADSRKDAIYEVYASADSVQTFKLPYPGSSFYRISLQWEMDDKQYRMESQLYNQ